METLNTTNPTVFLDNIGRTIIGEITNETESTLSVKNPALVHISTNPQTNQLSLQIFPLFFKEFQAAKSEPTIWVYNKQNITKSEPINFAPAFVAQYQQLFQMLEQGSVTAPSQKEPEVVKLFDDEDNNK